MYLAIVLLPSNVHRGRGAAELLRRLPRDPVGRRAVQRPAARHDAARRPESPRRAGQPHRQHDARHLLLSAEPDGAPRSASRATSARSAARSRVTVSSVSAPGRSPCHSASGETWRFFEIDPTGRRHRQVAAVHLSHQLPSPSPTSSLGDARLTHRQGGERELRPAHRRRLLVGRHPDAPADGRGHRASTPRSSSRTGAGVLHISNRYLDLEAVLATTIPKVAGPASARDRGRCRRRLRRHRLDRRRIRQEHAGDRPFRAVFRARETCRKARSGPGPTMPPIFWGRSWPVETAPQDAEAYARLHGPGLVR